MELTKVISPLIDKFNFQLKSLEYHNNLLNINISFNNIKNIFLYNDKLHKDLK